MADVGPLKHKLGIPPRRKNKAGRCGRLGLPRERPLYIPRLIFSQVPPFLPKDKKVICLLSLYFILYIFSLDLNSSPMEVGGFTLVLDFLLDWKIYTIECIELELKLKFNGSMRTRLSIIYYTFS